MTRRGYKPFMCIDLVCIMLITHDDSNVNNIEWRSQQLIRFSEQ